MTRSPHLYLLAGEASGDLHGAEVARAIRSRWPDCVLEGLGGSRMRSAGVATHHDLDELAVMGFVEVALRLPFFWRLEREIDARIQKGGLDAILLIDYPGLNLRVARIAHRAGIPVLYYIPPKVWAWKASRARTLARYVDRVAAIFPFEEAFLRERGVRARFVGHPLCEQGLDLPTRDQFRCELGLRPEQRILALFPGSRSQEIERHLELFTDVAVDLEREFPEVCPVLARASTVSESRLARSGFPVTERGRALLRHADAALVKSGTTTLEAALERTPAVVVYRMHPITSAIAHRVVDIPFISLPNLVLKEEVYPELVQDEATPERIFSALRPLLDLESAPRREMVGRLDRIREVLGAQKASEGVVAMLEEMVGPDVGTNRS